MPKVVYLGIDAGTTKTKAALVDAGGQIIDMVSDSVEVLHPFESACEIDMELLWAQLCILLQMLKAQNPDIWGQIVGVGISAQGDGMWPIGKDGKPVRNAILWNDNRTRCLGLDPEHDERLNALLVENASTALFAGAFPLILKWMKETEPECFGRVGYAVRCKDWLNYKLTGCIKSDYTDFSTCGTNIFTKEYVDPLFDYLGIPEAKEMLPPLIAPTDIVGAVSAEGEAACGIRAGTPVICGAIDVVATVLGAGVKTAGDGCTILGTTLCNEILIEAGDVDVHDRHGSALCSILPGKYVRVMAANSGNSTLDWIKGILAHDMSFHELEAQLAKVPVGSDGVLYHPYIYGERAPFRDPFACGGFYGLTVRHGRFEMMRAAYEGMVLSLKDCYRALPQTSGKIYLSGGGAVSNFTCQMVADALGKEVLRPTGRKELGIFGIVEAIKMGLGHGDTNGGCDQQCDIFVPDHGNTLLYENLFTQFLQLKDHMADFWRWRPVYCPTKAK